MGVRDPPPGEESSRTVHEGTRAFQVAATSASIAGMESLVADRTLPVELEETSDVVALPPLASAPQGGFLVVSDIEARAARVVPGQGTTYLALPGLDGKESGLEAVAYDAATHNLFCHVEEAAELLAFRWDGEASTVGPPTRRPLRLGKKRNKGVEGLIHLPAAASPIGRAGLLVANEDKPRAIFFLADGAGDEEPVEIELDRGVAAACDDFSGLSYDAGRGSVLLVSDESAALVEIELVAQGGGVAGRLRAAFHLEDARGKALERVEGVAVDAAGAWWVLLENDRELRRVRTGQGPG
jgi:uncharacterized protein YjiK